MSACASRWLPACHTGTDRDRHTNHTNTPLTWSHLSQRRRSSAKSPCLHSPHMSSPSVRSSGPNGGREPPCDSVTHWALLSLVPPPPLLLPLPRSFFRVRRRCSGSSASLVLVLLWSWAANTEGGCVGWAGAAVVSGCSPCFSSFDGCCCCCCCCCC